MNLAKNYTENSMRPNSTFIDNLCYLGGNLGFVILKDSNLSLEEFFIESSFHLYDEARITQCLLNWIYSYGNYINETSIFNLILNDNKRNAEMKFLINFCEKYSKNKNKWSQLKNLLSNQADIELPFVFRPNPKQYLKSESYFRNFCPEMDKLIKSNLMDGTT